MVVQKSAARPRPTSTQPGCTNASNQIRSGLASLFPLGGNIDGQKPIATRKVCAASGKMNRSEIVFFGSKKLTALETAEEGDTLHQSETSDNTT